MACASSDKSRLTKVDLPAPDGPSRTAERFEIPIVRELIEPAVGLQPYQARKLAFAASLTDTQIGKATKMMMALYKAFIATDASLLEINPLITTKTGDLETAEDIKRRIDAASRYVSLDQLALSPQCGFSSTVLGNNITVERIGAQLHVDANGGSNKMTHQSAGPDFGTNFGLAFSNGSSIGFAAPAGRRPVRSARRAARQRAVPGRVGTGVQGLHLGIDRGRRRPLGH